MLHGLVGSIKLLRLYSSMLGDLADCFACLVETRVMLMIISRLQCSSHLFDRERDQSTTSGLWHFENSARRPQTIKP